MPVLECIYNVYTRVHYAYSTGEKPGSEVIRISYTVYYTSQAVIHWDIPGDPKGNCQNPNEHSLAILDMSGILRLHITYSEKVFCSSVWVVEAGVKSSDHSWSLVAHFNKTIDCSLVLRPTYCAGERERERERWIHKKVDTKIVCERQKTERGSVVNTIYNIHWHILPSLWPHAKC